MKYEKSLIKDLGDYSQHPDYLPGAVPTKGNKVQNTGQYDNPKAAGIGGKKAAVMPSETEDMPEGY